MQNRSKSAMMIAEVLVALIILFLAVITATVATKLYISTQFQKYSYEELYIAATSIMDKLNDNLCSGEMSSKGRYNNFTYSAKCVLKNESRNYREGFDIDDAHGFIGNYQLKLYKVELTLTKENFSKKLIYDKMTQMRMF